MGDDLDNNNNPSNEGTEPEVQETPVPQQTDPYDPGTYQIGDGRLNLKFVTYDTIEFVKDNGSVANVPIINIVPGEASGTSLVICSNEQEFNDVRNVPDKAFAYRTDLNALFVRWQGAWMPVKTTSTLELEQGTPTFVTPNYAEKDKDETITGTWTFNENTTFKKDISSDTFQSGLNGWRLKDDSLEVENLTVRNKLKTNVFEIDKIKATNGSLYVSSCTTLTYVGNEPEVSLRGAAEPSESPTDVFTGTTYYVTFQEDVFEVGDIIQCHTSNKNYTAIVRASNLILLEADPVGNPAVEDEVVKINSTIESRNGSILLTSDLDNAPYIEVRKGDTAKVRFGNLSGINDLEGYGLYADNAYLTGTFKLSNGNALIDANGNNIVTQVGQIPNLQSRILQAEDNISSLVVDDKSNIFAYTLPEEESSSTVLSRWKAGLSASNPNLSIDGNYVKWTNDSNYTTIIILKSLRSVTFSSGTKLYFKINIKTNISNNSEYVFTAYLSSDISGNEHISDDIYIYPNSTLNKEYFTLNNNIQNQYIYLNLKPYTLTASLEYIKFREELLTSDKSYMSLIKLTANSISVVVSNELSNVDSQISALQSAMSLKASTTYVNLQLNNKANTSDLNSKVDSTLLTGIIVEADSKTIINAADNFRIGKVLECTENYQEGENEYKYSIEEDGQTTWYKFSPTVTVDANGNLETTGGASFKGNISAESGEFGIFEIGGETGNYIKTKLKDLYFGKTNEIETSFVNLNSNTISYTYTRGLNNLSYEQTVESFTVSAGLINKPVILEVNCPSWNLGTGYQLDDNATQEDIFQSVNFTCKLQYLGTTPSTTVENTEISITLTNYSNNSGVFKSKEFSFTQYGDYLLVWSITFTDQPDVLIRASYQASVKVSIFDYANNGTYITEDSIIKKDDNSFVLINKNKAMFTYGNYSLVINSDGINAVKNGVITPILV